LVALERGELHWSRAPEATEDPVEEGHKVTKTSWTFGVVWCRMNEWNRKYLSKEVNQ
jgi:hypothetical protein